MLNYLLVAYWSQQPGARFGQSDRHIKGLAHVEVQPVAITLAVQLGREPLPSLDLVPGARRVGLFAIGYRDDLIG